MKKPFVVFVSVSFLVLLAGYFFHQEITSRNLPKPDHIKIVSVPAIIDPFDNQVKLPHGFILDEEQPIKEVGALRAELEQLKEEFKLIRINSGRMVEQVNALTQVVHELKKSYKVSENTTKPNTEELVTKSKKPKFKNGYVPYRETGDPTHQEAMLHMLDAQIQDNTFELEKMNRILRDYNYRR